MRACICAIIIALSAVTVGAGSANAQWRVSTTGQPMAESSGSQGLGVGVTCVDGRRSVAIILPGEDLTYGSVGTRWSDGTTTAYTFRTGGARGVTPGALIGTSAVPDFERMIDKLRRLNSVTLRVRLRRTDGILRTRSACLGLRGLSARSAARVGGRLSGARRHRRDDRHAPWRLKSKQKRPRSPPWCTARSRSSGSVRVPMGRRLAGAEVQRVPVEGQSPRHRDLPRRPNRAPEHLRGVGTARLRVRYRRVDGQRGGCEGTPGRM